MPVMFAEKDEPFVPLRYDARLGQWRVGDHGLLPGDGLEVRLDGRTIGASVVLVPGGGWRLLTDGLGAVLMAPVEGLPARVV